MRPEAESQKMIEVTGYEWRPLKYEGINASYIISERAEIYNYKLKRFLSRTRYKGYPYVVLRSGNEPKFLQVFELMLRAFPECYEDSPLEKWRAVVIDGEETDYEVSDLGVVRRKNNHRILKPAKHKEGYLFIRLRHKGKTVTEYIHRLVAKAFIENPNDYDIVNHKDEDRENNAAINLEWCDRRYNILYNGAAKRAGMNAAITRQKKQLSGA